MDFQTPIEGIEREKVKLYKSADSRLQFAKVTHPTLPLERTFCVLCGKPWGYCSTNSSQHNAPDHIVVTCDDCDMAMIALGAQAVPQSTLDAFGLVREPQPVAEAAS